MDGAASRVGRAAGGTLLRLVPCGSIGSTPTPLRFRYPTACSPDLALAYSGDAPASRRRHFGCGDRGPELLGWRCRQSGAAEPGTPGPERTGGDRPAVRSAPVGRRPGSAGVPQGRPRRRGAPVDPGADDVRSGRARLGAGPVTCAEQTASRSLRPQTMRSRPRSTGRRSTTSCCRDSGSSGPSSEPTSSTEASRSPPYAKPAA